MAVGRGLARGLYRISGPHFPPVKSNLGGSPQRNEGSALSWARTRLKPAPSSPDLVVLCPGGTPSSDLPAPDGFSSSVILKPGSVLWVTPTCRAA